MNDDDGKDYSRWQGFVSEHVQHFNPRTLEQMKQDINDIEQGMRDVVRPIINRKEK